MSKKLERRGEETNASVRVVWCLGNPRRGGSSCAGGAAGHPQEGSGAGL